MTSNDAKYAAKTRTAWMQTAAVATVTAILWLVLGFANREEFLHGAYGDTFGILTALFTGLALAGLWCTIRLQSIELEATRDVLQQQTDQLDKQAAHLESQAGHLEQQLALARTQAIEATFFQLLQRFSEVARDVRFDHLGDKGTGRDAMRKYYGVFQQGVSKESGKEQVRDWGTEQARNIVRREAGIFFDTHGSELDHYFRALFHVFKFVDEHVALTPHQKIAYTKIARAQLSSPELSMIFYNGITGKGLEFQDLIKRYGLLEHVDRNALIYKDHTGHNVFYHLDAFKGSADRGR